MASFIILPRNRLIRFAFKIIFFIGILTFFIDIFSLNQFIADCTNQQNVGLVENRFLAVKLSPDHCPLKSSNLIGFAKVYVGKQWIDLINKGLTLLTVKTGGRYEPTECRPRYNVAIVVPYRNREAHLKAFLANLHPFLQRQQLAYTIFIVEQSNSLPFNRGMLMNVGYVEALKTNQTFDCFYFHDVDLVPEDDRHSYACPEEGRPRQMAVLMSTYNYKRITHFIYFGGVTSLATGDFKTINGFSNCYWGWGAEDDDLWRRVIFHKMTVAYHQPESETRYTMLFHTKAVENPKRFEILNGAVNRTARDGLLDLQYRLLDLQLKPLYTHILVDIQPIPGSPCTLSNSSSINIQQ